MLALALVGQTAAAQTFSVSFPASKSPAPLDGRLLVMISADTTGEPRLQVSDAANTAQVFGVDVDGWRADAVYSGTQKCLGVPPGLSPVTFSDRAVERIRTRSTPAQSTSFKNLRPWQRKRFSK